ncbi:hypothetical protein EI94DRAFT_1892930 [Lactarius quietus]|nr:hypothetical protein EI94DRAFT_1892930 [Lactarius quietus]
MTTPGPTPTPTYWKNMALMGVTKGPPEDIVLAVFSQFLRRHIVPLERLILYPQLTLKWKPSETQDMCAEVPVTAVGNFTIPGAIPPFKIRFGVEIKRATVSMCSMPPASSLLRDIPTIQAFNLLYFEAKNNAKAAIKGDWEITPGIEDRSLWPLF